jgi:hypothetical protein
MPLSSPRFAGDPVLEGCLAGKHRMLSGEQGPAVAKVQQALIDLGFSISSGATGGFFNQTGEAVVRFKTAHHLSPNDPVVGSGTMSALDSDIIAFDARTEPPKPDGGAKASGAKNARGCYTDNVNEVETKNTRPVSRALVDGIRACWPELTEEGAIALAAQSSAETGHWDNCWNWNFGNAKASERQLHMYLHGTWEGFVRHQVKEPDGSARLETDDEVLARVRAADPARAQLIQPDPSPNHAKAVGPSKASIIYNPPHPAARFAARPSMEAGLEAWVGKMKGYAEKHPGFLDALNSGDAKTIAQVLRKNRYYTADERAYAAALAAHQKLVKRDLGIR